MTFTVSIIVPNYNHEKYLEKRISSIMEQTYRDFELILLDDQSTDNSRQIIEKYRDLPNVRICYNEKNSGNPFFQWNKGVGLARGKYVWIAESDDFAHSEFLEHMVETLEQAPEAGFVFCKPYKVDENDEIIAEWEEWAGSDSPETWKEDFLITGQEAIEKFLIFSCKFANASAILFRKSALEKAGGADETMRTSGDHMTYCRLASVSSVAFINKSLSYYRSGSSNVRPSANYLAVCLSSHYSILNYIKENFSIPDAIWEKALAQAAATWANSIVSLKNGFVPLSLNIKIWKISRKIDPHILRKMIAILLLRPFNAVYRRLFKSHS